MKKKPVKYGDQCIHGTNTTMTCKIGGHRKAKTLNLTAN